MVLAMSGTQSKQFSNDVKFGVTFDTQSELIASDSSKPLVEIMADVFAKFKWTTKNYMDYSLIVPPKNGDSRKEYIYITDENRSLLATPIAQVVHLRLCPSVSAQNIVSGLKSGDQKRTGDALAELIDLLPSDIFASEFVKEQGPEMLMHLVENMRDMQDPHRCTLLLETLCELSEYALSGDDLLDSRRLFSWHLAKDKCILAVLNYCKDDNLMRVKGLTAALRILVNFLQNCCSRSQLIIPQIDPDFIYRHLTKKQVADAIIRLRIQINLIALMNSIFEQTLHHGPNNLRTLINNFLAPGRIKQLVSSLTALQTYSGPLPSAPPLTPGGSGGSANEAALELQLTQQLAHLQHFMLFPFGDDLNTPLDRNKQQVAQNMNRLVSIVYPESDNSNNPRLLIEAYKKLGFDNPENPYADFEAPPAQLAFQSIYHFAFRAPDKANEMVKYSTPTSIFPMIAAAKVVIRLLCELFGIGEEWQPGQYDLCPMLFNSEVNKVFEETFLNAFQIFFSTWVDMQAGDNDIDQVERVVRAQLVHALGKHPSKFEEFHRSLAHFGPTEVKKMWDREHRDKQSTTEQTHPAIIDLRGKLNESHSRYVMDHRLRAMEQATDFTCAVVPTGQPGKAQRSKERPWRLQLSPDHKVIHVKNVEPPQTWQISSLKLNVQGEPENRRTDKADRTFYLDLEEPDPPQMARYSIVAPDTRIYNVWMDGLRILLNQPGRSREFEEQVDRLVKLDLTVRLLGLDLAKIPAQAPVVPNDPPNYDLCED